MSSLLNVNEYPRSEQLLAALNERFERGIPAVDLVKGTEIVGTVLSRAASQKAMARQVAEQWLANPEILKDLEASLKEKPELWE